MRRLVGRAFRRAAGAGLAQLLSQMVPMAMAIHRTSVDGVHILPAGNVRIGVDERRVCRPSSITCEVDSTGSSSMRRPGVRTC